VSDHVARCVDPVAAAGGDPLTTLSAFLESGSALEACARALFVHPNTVRYRLRRVSELTGLNPAHARDALVLRSAVMAARLDLGRDPVDLT
jgi:DNA-binding PucR family transcriptional regulator